MVSCLCCGSEAVYSWGTKNAFSLARCKNCDLFFVTNIPSQVEACYSAGYFTGDLALDGYMDYESDKEAARSTYTTYAELMGPGSGKRLLEVGCATGFFMELAERLGWRTQGIDISSYAVAQAQAKGMDVSHASFEQFDVTGKEGTYGAVVLFDVLEHVVDPLVVMQKVYTLLEPGGVVVLSTPDAGSLWARAWGRRWHAVIPPQHLYFFNTRNVTRLLNNHRFHVAHVGHYGKHFTLPYITRLMYSWTHLQLFATVAMRCSQSRLKKISIPLNVRDTMFVLARKK